MFKAKNRISQQYAAAKIIELNSEEDIEEHATEIDILAKCDHKNIVKLVDSILADRKLWILIEFCEGGALDDIIEKGQDAYTLPLGGLSSGRALSTSTDCARRQGPISLWYQSCPSLLRSTTV